MIANIYACPWTSCNGLTLPLLASLAGFARAKENPKRYIIGAMKKEIQK